VRRKSPRRAGKSAAAGAAAGGDAFTCGGGIFRVGAGEEGLGGVKYKRHRRAQLGYYKEIDSLERMEIER